MNLKTLLLSAAGMVGSSGAAHATLALWQNAVIAGAPTTTLFSTVNGSSPQLFNVGSLSGDRSLEFIYNASAGGVSQALIGSQAGTSGAQGLKANQYNNTGAYGMTDFGIADYISPIPALVNQDVHIVFSSNGTDTKMYVNSNLLYTFTGVSLKITGLNAIAAASNPDGTVFFDNLAGSVLGFASFDYALGPGDVSGHYLGFIVPEPGTAGMLTASAALLVAGRRRRK